jgi:hypothetical protein
MISVSQARALKAARANCGILHAIPSKTLHGLVKNGSLSWEAVHRFESTPSGRAALKEWEEHHE